MSAALYHDALKGLAQAAHGAGRLDGASIAVRLDNPLCGDRIDMQVRLAGGRIAAIAYEVRGCLLCRAAASVVGLRAPQGDRAAVAAAQASLTALLAGSAATPLWPELLAFGPLRAHPSRRACVCLPLEALGQALARAARERFPKVPDG